MRMWHMLVAFYVSGYGWTMVCQVTGFEVLGAINFVAMLLSAIALLTASKEELELRV